jgi:hypothetical protein
MSFRIGVMALAAGLVLGPAAVNAEMPSGEYNFDLAETPVWDISGTYNEEVEDLTTTYTITTEPGGKFLGVGTAVQDDFESHVEASFTFTGAMKSAGAVTRVAANWKMNGTVEVDGITGTFTASIKQNLEIDPNSHQMVGIVTGKIKVTVPGEGSQSVKLDPGPAFIELPEDMNGGWTLALDITNVETKHSGSASVQLSNGDEFQFGLTGNYSSKTDLSKISLKGTGLNSALNLKLATSVVGGQMTIRTMKGKLFGQTVVSGVSGGSGY